MHVGVLSEKLALFLQGVQHDTHFFFLLPHFLFFSARKMDDTVSISQIPTRRTPTFDMAGSACLHFMALS